MSLTISADSLVSVLRAAYYTAYKNSFEEVDEKYRVSSEETEKEETDETEEPGSTNLALAKFVLSNSYVGSLIDILI